MKTIVMGLLGALISINALASVKCFVQVGGEAKELNPVKNSTAVLDATIGSIQATALVSLDSQDELTDLQIKDANFRVMSIGAYDLSKRPAVLYATIGNTLVTLTCSK